MHLPRYDLPEAATEEHMHFAISPTQRELYESLLREGSCQEAYLMCNKAAEAMLAVQLHSAVVPKKCKGRG